MQEIVLWKGIIKEIDSPESGRPLVYFDCGYDSGHLLYDGKSENYQGNFHLLVLEHGIQFPGNVGQGFSFIIKLYEDHEDYAWDTHSSLIVGTINQIIEIQEDLIYIKSIISSGLICPKENGYVALTFEKGKILGRLGQIVQLSLYLEE